MPGFKIQLSSLSQNSVLKFAATSPDVQEITINSTSIVTAVNSFSTAKGVSVVANQANTHLLVRLTATKNARLKLFNCSALEDLGMQPQIIVPGIDKEQIGTVPFVSGPDKYEFSDLDGNYLDTYFITSQTGSFESIPSVIKSPLLDGVDYCIAEARFIDVQGRPVRGVMVSASPAVLDTEGLAANRVTVYSDAYGRISFPLLRCQMYVLSAPAIGYNQFIETPDLPFVDITKLPATTRPEMTP